MVNNNQSLEKSENLEISFFTIAEKIVNSGMPFSSFLQTFDEHIGEIAPPRNTKAKILLSPSL